MIKYVIKKPITTIMFFLAVVLVGFLSVMTIPKDLYPSITLPYAVVVTTYEGAGPEEIESLITKPLESAVSTVSDLKSISSTSSNGTSMIIAEFNESANMDFVALNIREKVDMIKGYLPKGAGSPMIMKIDPNQMPIMSIGVSSETYDLVKLKSFIDDNMINKIERINGVAQVSVAGDREEEIKVTVIPEKMKAFGLTTSTISNLLASENLNLPGGQLLEGDKDITVRTIGEFSSIEDIKRFPIQTSFGTVYLGDIANIEKAYKDVSTYSYINGKPAISLSIQKQSIANTVEISKKILKEINNLRKEYNGIISIDVTYDSAEYINSSLESVMSSALFGGILAVLILYLFLRNIGSTLVIATSIPTSVLATFAIMWLTGNTLNIISLGALTVALGMVVDASIVVLENIDIHRKLGKDSKTAAYDGTKEVVTAVAASVLTSIVVFIPFVFTTGVIMKMLHILAWVVIYALVSSIVVALTLVPMLSSKLGDEFNHHAKGKLLRKFTDGFKKWFAKVEVFYAKILEYAVHHRRKVMYILFTFFAVSLLTLFFIDIELMPSSDEGTYTIGITLPKGTNIEKTLELSSDLADEVKKLKNVRNVYLTVGSSGNMGLTASSSNSATITVDIGPSTERRESIDDAIDDARVLISNIPGAEFEVSSSSSSSMDSGSPVDLRISGENLDTLHEIADDIVEIFNEVDGLYEIQKGNEKGDKEANIVIDRIKLAQHAISTSQVAYGVQTSLLGSSATKLKLNDEEIDVTIKLDDTSVKYIKDISNIYIDSPKGYSVSLIELGDIVIENAPSSIIRNDQKRTLDITAKISGIALGTAQKEIESKLKNYAMKDGYTYEWSGSLETLSSSFNSLIIAIIMAIILVYMVMASQFESLLDPFIIMFTIPFAFAGSFYGLFLTGCALNVTSMIGFIVLVGTVVNNGIILIDFIIQARENGAELFDAVINSGKVRLRPILMTTLTTILGMTPMALGLGEGGELMQGMAVSIIFGLMTSTVLTLVLIPVLYVVFNNRVKRLKEKRRIKKEKKKLFKLQLKQHNI